MEFSLNADKINYVKIFYKDSNDFSHCVKSFIKQINDTETRVFAKTDEKIAINTPQQVNLYFIAEDGLYKALSTLKYTNWDEPYTYFIIEKPKELTYEQNREYFRIKIEEDLTLSFINDKTQESIECKTYDLSANGIKVVLPRQINIPETVTIEINLRGKTIITDAKYIRTDSDDNILKASFHFLTLKDNDKDYISQICIIKQLEEKRNKL